MVILNMTLMFLNDLLSVTLRLSVLLVIVAFRPSHFEA